MPRDKTKLTSSSSPTSSRSGPPAPWQDFLAAEKERLLRENPKMKNKAILKKASQAYRKHKAEWEAQQAAKEE
ncbi:uncharacterized protein JCM10292_002095 [Rhodotorula paludigena]|uniref:uncharacterized protein n=1 Tax=Rhodotorula paludigena TaxID=86838 RepID=UPI00316BD786